MWADFKSHIKAKMRRNKVSVGGTGGGPSRFVPLSSTEERVVELLQLHTLVDGIPNSKSFGIVNTVNTGMEIDLNTDTATVINDAPSSSSSDGSHSAINTRNTRSETPTATPTRG